MCASYIILRYGNKFCVYTACSVSSKPWENLFRKNTENYKERKVSNHLYPVACVRKFFPKTRLYSPTLFTSSVKIESDIVSLT